MSKVIKRLLTFFVGVPLCIFLTWFCTYKNHALLNGVVVVASVLASYEMYQLLKAKYHMQNKVFVLFLSLLISLCAFVVCIFNLPQEIIFFALAACFISVLIKEIFCKKSIAEHFEHSIENIMTSFFVLFYASFLLSFLQRMALFANAHAHITVFILMVFMCDSIAWVFGMLFGKNNRGVVAVSPNKSLAGFAGGVIGSIAVAVLAYIFLPAIFGESLCKMIVLGAVTSCSAILGDLAESVIKRSTHNKDSGFLIPGRGGLLDSIDSIILASPVYYIAVHFLF